MLGVEGLIIAFFIRGEETDRYRDGDTDRESITHGCWLLTVCRGQLRRSLRPLPFASSRFSCLLTELTNSLKISVQTNPTRAGWVLLLSWSLCCSVFIIVNQGNLELQDFTLILCC